MEKLLFGYSLEFDQFDPRYLTEIKQMISSSGSYMSLGELIFGMTLEAKLQLTNMVESIDFDDFPRFSEQDSKSMDQIAYLMRLVSLSEGVCILPYEEIDPADALEFCGALSEAMLFMLIHNFEHIRGIRGFEG